MKKAVDVQDAPQASRYADMVKDFYKSITGEIENPFSYEHEYRLQKILRKIVGEN